MYLKSLVLKGFKSFADRCVLNLEPGMTCIVGPNGSGKSNISDAILWVLGERSPKNLRGSSMEDVIFAGSKGRKAVNVAEVTLVLDNSDAQIPVEYTEIELTRRMYRTGGSDYLINGAPARLMDFLNILHDTGLGTGTHSIISQGNLEAILQSKPEDRRALIEEAAGVLKHKQRKEQSARKLELMDGHLARVRDIYGEVTRQLGPLERKAKKALTYKELSEEYAGLRLALAVDDLRILQRRWDEVQEARSGYEATCTGVKARLDEAEATVEQLSEALEAESRNREAAMRQRARVASLASQVDATRTLLRQTAASAEARIAEERAAAASLAAEGTRLAAELVRLEEARAKAAADVAAAQAARDEVGRAQVEAADEARDARAVFERLSRERRGAEDELARVRKRLSVAQTEFDSDDHHLAFVNTRIAEAREALAALQEEEQQARKAAEAAQRALADAKTADEEAEARAEDMKARVAEAEARHGMLMERVAVLEAESRALAELERARDAGAGEARAWALSAESPLAGAVRELSAAITVDEGWDDVVERVLRESLGALLVDDAVVTDAIDAFGARMKDRSLQGDVLLLGQGRAVADARAWVASQDEGTGAGMEALLAHVSCAPEAATRVEALLGDVVAVDSLAEALRAHVACAEPLRFVTRDGHVVAPGGLVILCGESDAPGTLARRRRAALCAEELRAARADLAACGEQKALLVGARAQAEAEVLTAARSVAVAEGRVRSLQASVQTATAKVTAAQADLSAYIDFAATLETKHSQAKPLIAAMEEQIAGLEAKVAAQAAELAAAEQQMTEARSRALDLGDALSKRVIALNTAQSALALAKSRLADRTAAGQSVEKRLEASLLVEGRKTVVLSRVAALEETYRALSARLDVLQDLPSPQADDAAESSAAVSLADRTGAARQEARQLRAAYDEASRRLADNRVETVQVQVQVQAAIDVITGECGTSVEAALRTAPLEDREAAEDRAGTCKRRMANLGSVSPEAADEYLAVKKRYDFLSAQLADLEAARTSLKKIDAVIDARMRTDFVDTFAVVNANFQEVFGILFPGGTAELVLVDPDDIENTGVEVIAQPRGKRITRMMLMSGGEKSLVALALLFAVYKTRTTPFYVLDEVEAALDDTNLRRLLAYLDELRATTQLIMITHQRRTMEAADVLFGVSMQNDGVTKVISQRLERALAYAE